ncbi:MAG: hypothetical protein MUD07_09545, partial [Burkholderiaceae bacterium]|nr:hypothetical protein [Burkholderiaceae bacterium]
MPRIGGEEPQQAVGKLPSVQVAGGLGAEQSVEHAQRCRVFARGDQAPRQPQLLLDRQHGQHVRLAHLRV